MSENYSLDQRAMSNRLKKKSKSKIMNFGDDVAQVETRYERIFYIWLMNTLINLFKYETKKRSYNGTDTNLLDSLDVLKMETLLRYGYPVAVGFDSTKTLRIFDFDQDAIGYGSYGDLLVKGVFDPYTKKPLKQITRLDISGDYVVICNKNNSMFLTSAYFSNTAYGTDLTRPVSAYSLADMSDAPVVDLYAGILARNKSSSYLNMLQQRMPYIAVTRNKNLTAMNIFAQAMTGKLVIEVDSKFDMDDLKVFPTEVPNLMKDLKEDFNNTISEFLTMYGINNAGVDKRERLLANEIDANTQLIEHSLNIYLDSRIDGFYLLNAAYGCDINITVDSDAYRKLVKQAHVFSETNEAHNKTVDSYTNED